MSTEKSALAQVVQVGVEATPGTAVAANRRLQSVSIDLSPSVSIDTHRPSGMKWPTLTVLGKEHTTAKVEGKPTYTEVVYLLSSALCQATITTPPACTNARLWTFAPSTTAADTISTLTIEKGGSGASDGVRATYGVCTGLEFKFSRDSIDVSGEMIARALETGITMTGSPTSLALVPVTPGQVSVFLDTTAAALGTTKLTRAFSVTAKVGDRHNPVWTIDAAASSYVATVEGEPSGEVSLLMAYDAAGAGQVARYRAGDTQFMRIEAKGALLDTGVQASAYRLTLDLALKVTGVGEFKDEGGVYAIEYTYAIVHDATWARALQVEVVNGLTAL